MTKIIDNSKIWKTITIGNLPNEEWKNIDGYEGRYQISTMGRVKSTNRRYGQPDIIKKLSRDTRGYPHTNFYDSDLKIKCVKVHRLVGMAFIQNSENKRTINHKNNIKTDNRVDNLEWMTDKENVIHSFENGFRNPARGGNHGCARINEGIAAEIWSNILNGERGCDIARRFNVPPTMIYNIKKGNTWNHVTGLKKVRRKK